MLKASLFQFCARLHHYPTNQQSRVLQLCPRYARAMVFCAPLLSASKLTPFEICSMLQMELLATVKAMKVSDYFPPEANIA